MTNHLSATSIIAGVVFIALITPLFALACHLPGGAEPSAFTDLQAAFTRFNR